MKRIFALLTAWAMVCGLSVSGNAAITSIDFDDFGPGVSITDQYTGVAFALLDIPNSYPYGPVTVDTDPGKYSGSLGRAVAPGDDRGDPFYDIEISFSPYIDYFSILSLDSDEPLTVRGYLNGIEVSSAYYPKGSDYQVWNVELGAVGGTHFFDTIVLDVRNNPGGHGTSGGPESFDNLSYNAVPAPTTLLLLVSGLVGLAAIRKKVWPVWVVD